VSFSMASPWIRMVNTPVTAEATRQLHPLRASRYLFSDFNPCMWPVQFWADRIKEKRAHGKPAAEDNPYVSWEKSMSDMIIDGLNQFRDARDGWSELMFKAIYENPGLKMITDFYGDENADQQKAA